MTEFPRALIPPPASPASPSPSPVTEIILESLQVARLETMLWKRRTMSLNLRQAENSMREAQEDAHAADIEFMRLARSYGIDVKRSFEWSESGKVIYAESTSSVPSASAEKHR